MLLVLLLAALGTIFGAMDGNAERRLLAAA
jgi:hypothetical protein